jgi:hypothetical protein
MLVLVSVQNWTQKNPNLTFMVMSTMTAMVETLPVDRDAAVVCEIACNRCTHQDDNNNNNK